MLDVVPPMVMPLANKGETYSPTGRNAFGAADEVRRHPFFFFFVTLVTEPRRSFSLKLGDARV